MESSAPVLSLLLQLQQVSPWVLAIALFEHALRRGLGESVRVGVSVSMAVLAPCPAPACVSRRGRSLDQYGERHSTHLEVLVCSGKLLFLLLKSRIPLADVASTHATPRRAPTPNQPSRSACRVRAARRWGREGRRRRWDGRRRGRRRCCHLSMRLLCLAVLLFLRTRRALAKRQRKSKRVHLLGWQRTEPECRFDLAQAQLSDWVGDADRETAPGGGCSVTATTRHSPPGQRSNFG